MAVALGVGIAVTVGPAPAWASPGASDQSSSESSTSDKSGSADDDNAADSARTAGPEDDGETEPEKNTTEPEENTTEPEENTTESEENTTESEENTTESEENTTEVLSQSAAPSAPVSPVAAAGGADTRVGADRSGTLADGGISAVDLAPSDPPVAVEDVTPVTGTQPVSSGSPVAPVTVDASDGDGTVVEQSLTEPVTATASTAADPAADPAVAGQPVAADVVTTTAATHVATPVSTAPDPASVPAVVGAAMTSVLGWVGLAPLAAPGAPAAPVSTPVAVLVLAFVRREIQQFLFNQSPVLRPEPTGQDPETGVVTGNLNAVDPERDPLSFRVIGNPANGTATVDAKGVYTFTPNAELAAAGGETIFTVAVTDNGFHLRGLLARLGLASTTTTEEVKVKVAAINRAPVAADDVASTPRSVPVTIAVLDNDSDALTVTGVTQPGNGRVVTDGATVTYTPATGYSGTDTFTYTVTDRAARTDTATVVVTVAGGVTPAFDRYDVGDTPTGVVVVGNRLYTTNFEDNTVTVVDLRTNTAIDTDADVPGVQPLSGFQGPTGVALRGNRLYVANLASESSSDTISVIDVDTNTVLDVDPETPGTQGITVGPNPIYIAIVDDRAYVSLDTGTVAVVDLDTNAVIDTDPETPGTQNIRTGGGQPNAITGSGDRVYVANLSSDSVTVIDTATNTVIDTDPDTPGTQNISGFDSPRAVAVVGGRLYVANTGSVSVIDLADFSPVDTDPATVGIQPIAVGRSVTNGIAVRGDRLYVTGPNSVSVIDTTSNRVVDTIAVGTLPTALFIDGDYLYVSNLGDATVSAIAI